MPVVSSSLVSNEITITQNRVVNIGEGSQLEISHASSKKKEFSLAIAHFPDLKKIILAASILPLGFTNALLDLVMEYNYSISPILLCNPPLLLIDHPFFNKIKNEIEPCIDRIVLAPLVDISESSPWHLYQYGDLYGLSTWSNVTIEAIFVPTRSPYSDFNVFSSFTSDQSRSIQSLTYFSGKLCTFPSSLSWNDRVSSSVATFQATGQRDPREFFSIGVDFLILVGKRRIIVTLLPIEHRRDESIENQVHRTFKKHLEQFAWAQFESIDFTKVC